MNQGQQHLRLAAAAIAAVIAVSLTACAGTPSGTSAPHSDSTATRSENFDQALHDQLPAEIRGAGIVKVGGSFESLPLLNADPTDANKPTGIAPELVELMEKVIGVKIEWRNTAWPGQIPGLQSNSLDALMGQISDTADREKSIADMVPFFLALTGVTYPSGNPNHVSQDLGSLCGLKVATVSGSLYIGMLQGASDKYCNPAGKEGINVLQYQNASAGIQSLLSGQADLYLDGAQTVRGIGDQNKGRLESLQLDYEQTKEWDPGLYGIAVGKNNTGLSNALLGAMQAIVKDGSYAKVLSKYGAESGILKIDQVKGNPLTGTPFGTKAG